jgi:YaiO family outer membrane protein
MTENRKIYQPFCQAVLAIALLLSFYETFAQSKSLSADQLFRQAQFETNLNKDYNKAIQLCKRALRMAPVNLDIRQLLGKLYLLSGETGLARIELKRVLARQPANIDVLNNLISVEINDKNFTAAMLYINSAARYKPDNIDLKLKKADVYAQQYKYAAALQISEKLYQTYPREKKVKQTYVEHLAGFSVLKRDSGDTAEAITLLEKAYFADPSDKDILLSLVNINYHSNNLDKAVFYCDKALEENRNDITFIIKKASILFESGKYDMATQTSMTLLKLDSNNTRFKSMYTEQLMAAHQKFVDSDEWNASLQLFRSAEEVMLNDSIVYITLATIYFNVKKYDSTLYYCELGLKSYPDDPSFLLKKVASLEAQGKYKAASVAAGKLAARDPGNLYYRQYAMSLKSRSFKNQLGLLYLHSMFNNEIKPADIASLQYIRFHKKGSIGARVNFGRRASGDGIQFEAETYLTHNKRAYSYALAGWSPSDIFPGWRFSYSLFSTLGKGWELETGARYLYADSISTISGVLSLGKYWYSNFTNLRGFLVYDEGNWYQSYLLSHRFYLNDKKDYLSFFGSVGSIPDDRSRNFLYNSTLGFSTWGAGIGFQKTFSTATTVNLTGSWTYQKTSEITSYDQYDIYISLLRKF